MSLKILYSEKLFIISIAAIAVIFNLLPYVYQKQNSTPDKIYTGSFPIILDKPTYLAEMVQGKENNWKIIDKYTSEPQKPVLIYTLYVLMGHVARISGLSLESVFFIGRFFFGLILLYTVIYFIRCFIYSENQRKLAYLFALFSSGFGWLTQIYSIDTWLPDTIPMVRFSYFPHIMMANAAFFLALLFFWRIFEEKNNRRWAILAGILLFVLNFVLPFSGLMLYFLAISLTFILYFKNKNSVTKNARNILLFYALSVPSLLYLGYLGTQDKIWSIIEKQNILPSPPPINIITGYGLVLFLSLYGLLILYRKDQVKGLFFTVWILSVPVLAYIPLWIYPMQRRFLETGFYVPLAITASFGAKGIYDHIKSKGIKDFKLKLVSIFGMFIFPFMIAGNIQNWLQFKYFFKQTDNSDFYTPKENIDAIEWLRDNSPENSIILSSLHSGNLIPYYANRTVYLGHAPSTLYVGDKYYEVENFYSEKYLPNEMFEFLKERKIDYVFYSNEEWSIGNLDPENYDFLNEVYPLDRNTAKTNLCPDNDNSADNRSSGCITAKAYKDKTVKIYKFINNN